MRYFNISFCYKGPTSDFGTAESERALDSAINTLERLLKDAKIDNVQEYAWTDGSLYRIVRFDDKVDISGAVEAVSKALVDSEISVSNYYSGEIDTDTYKKYESRALTLEERFARCK